MGIPSSQVTAGQPHFISDYLDRATGVDGVAVDTDRLLPEPFPAEELLNRVRDVLDG